MANVAIKDATGATVNVAADTDSGGVELQRVELAALVSGTITPNSPSAPASVAVTDGGDVTQGTQADAAWSGTGSGSVVALLKAVWTRLRGGQAPSAASLPVVVASDQTVPVSAASLPLPTGAATSALQTTGNTSLATLATNLPAAGQKTMAASLPVVVASDQGAIPVTGGGSASFTYCAQVSSATTAAQLTSNTCSEVLLQNDPGSANNILIGSSTAQAIVLKPGDSIAIPVTNTSLIGHKTAVGTASLNVLARA